MKFIKLTLVHNNQPIYINAERIETIVPRIEDGELHGSAIFTASMRDEDGGIIVKENYSDIEHLLYWEDIGDVK